MEEKNLSLSVVVMDSQMFLKMMINEESILIPFEEAHNVVTKINQLVPYNYGDKIFIEHTFNGWF